MIIKFPVYVFVSLMFFSCGTADIKSDGHSVQVQTTVDKSPVFNPNSITKEEKEIVRIDANKFVGDVNKIIQRKDFSAWTKYLEPKYKERLESKNNLEQASMSERLKQQGVVLKTLFDYFIHVVVPSRSNLRVDDIEFLSENRVKAFMEEKGQRLLIYELERNGDSWRIVK
ncbi:MAG: hypothetical protein LBD07_04565 [Spirochaetaceae bacterium]|jgi:hypothetical protein|nr:hypothetical protein [Spirochaetaceae bacterium]